MDDFTGKVAVVTGAASGIGRGIGSALLERGATVCFVDRDAAGLASLESTTDAGARAVTRVADVTDRAAMATLAAEIEAEFGGVDILCNNAGIGSVAAPYGAGYADWDRTLAVNLGGVVNGVVSFVPGMIAHGRGGHIVNTSSMAGLLPLPDSFCIYTTSKFAVVGLSLSLRATLEKEKIGVSVLCPGLVDTAIAANEARVAADRGVAGSSVLDECLRVISHGMAPVECGRKVVAGIEANQPYIITHGEFRAEVEDQVRVLLESFGSESTVAAVDLSLFYQA